MEIRLARCGDRSAPHHVTDPSAINEKDEQRRLFEPGNERRRSRKESANDAKFPGPWAQSGHNAEGEQRQENAPQGVASDQPLNLADVDPTHSGQEGRPLAELNRHHLESSATRWQVAQPTATPRSALIGVVATQ
jgi:hypothetical protein